MSDARFYFSSCQMFIFLIFADTRRSILICYKEQVRWVYSEKKCKALQKFRKGKSTKDIAAKSGSSLHGRNIKKNLWHI